AKDWVANNCSPGTQPDYLTIGASNVRAQALTAGEIDATTLEVSDVVTLESSDQANFAKVVDFAEELPDLRPQTVYANAEFTTEHRDVTQAFVTALAEEHAKINADPQHLVELVGRYLPEEDPGEIAEVAQRYVDAKLFDAGALTEQNMQATIDFFARAGVLEPGLTVQDAVDLSFIRDAP
ncbi:MAG: ABC transporter substrate-binding protein, partial [Pseudonocardia sp.]